MDDNTAIITNIDNDNNDGIIGNNNGGINQSGCNDEIPLNETVSTSETTLAAQAMQNNPEEEAVPLVSLGGAVAFKNMAALSMIRQMKQRKEASALASAATVLLPSLATQGVASVLESARTSDSSSVVPSLVLTSAVNDLAESKNVDENEDEFDEQSHTEREEFQSSNGSEGELEVELTRMEEEMQLLQKEKEDVLIGKGAKPGGRAANSNPPKANSKEVNQPPRVKHQSASLANSKDTKRLTGIKKDPPIITRGSAPNSPRHASPSSPRNIEPSSSSATAKVVSTDMSTSTTRKIVSTYALQPNAAPVSPRQKIDRPKPQRIKLPPLIEMLDDTYHCFLGPDELPGLRAWNLESLGENGEVKWELKMQDYFESAPSTTQLDALRIQRAKTRRVSIL